MMLSFLGFLLIVLGGSDYFLHWLLPRNEKGAYYIASHWWGIESIQLTIVMVGALLLILGLLYRRKKN